MPEGQAAADGAAVGDNGKTDGVRELLRQQDADVMARGEVLGRVALVVQEAVVGGARLVGVDKYGVLGHTDGVAAEDVVDIAGHEQQAHIDILPAPGKPDALHADRVLTGLLEAPRLLGNDGGDG